MRFKALKARKIHRWLTLLFGIQLIVWSLTGAAMVVLQLPYIHGGHLVQPADRPIANFSLLDNIPELTTQYPQATEVNLVNRFIDNKFQHFFEVLDSERRLVHAQSLEQITLQEEHINALALRFYAPRGAQTPTIAHTTLLTEATERELAPRHLPAWQVTFSDRVNATLYLSAATGDLVTQRHTAWRFFDFMWMLHIMDYQERADISKPWLQFFSVLTLLISFSGVFLLSQKYLSRPWRRLWRDWK